MKYRSPYPGKGLFKEHYSLYVHFRRTGALGHGISARDDQGCGESWLRAVILITSPGDRQHYRIRFRASGFPRLQFLPHFVKQISFRPLRSTCNIKACSPRSGSKLQFVNRNLGESASNAWSPSSQRSSLKLRMWVISSFPSLNTPTTTMNRKKQPFEAQRHHALCIMLQSGKVGQ